MFASGQFPELLNHVRHWLGGFALALVMMGVGAALERRWPAELLQSRAGMRFNVVYAALYMALAEAMRPLMAMASVAIINALGGGWVVLASRGWGALASMVVVLLTFDVLEYAFHRLQHAWPVLWKLHSLHHSAAELNVTVTFRHHWFEVLLKGCLLYPVVGVLFKVEPWIVGVTAVIFMFANYFAHMNLRIDLGRFTTWVNNPQYHRLHHSNRTEHFDHNFTQLLPLWDHLFGTLWVPSKHEWPATGLHDGAQPRSLLGALSWPLRSQAGRILGNARAAHRFAARQTDDHGGHDEHA
ncbi:sterol desaturase family protein [Paraburkholderia madseniana]|uniref:Sterol desaturase family protein n=1 Tax=Paraburkholderia madseniana TaxID=2599607 RepID=A0AAP5BEA9_9BURK|nr:MULTISPECIES: sterol desaturase family protein [Paraburkholderia]MCX4148164.1 sterol desaturase family protein [Paraburkholderia madseniana]MDN7151103.1 sterol desaturase family protein [Paraburkholderia sp. WS6]MDQ6409983.1 sterol desaturase family protein [Paraburkholderia madseniana]